MKLLFLTNLYPPYHLGGTELLCHEVATQLMSRSHAVEVLTSTFRASPDLNERGIQRRLRLQSDVYHYRPQQVLHYFPDRRANLQIVRETLIDLQPDVVVIWGMWNLSYTVAAEVESIMGSKVAYYFGGPWPLDVTPHESFWTGRQRTSAGRVFLHLLRPLVARALRYEWRPCKLRLQNCAVCSISTEQEMREAGIGPDHYRLVYHGIDADAFRTARLNQPRESVEGKLRAVFVGSLLPEKGAHTAVEALGLLAHTHPSVLVTLDILGAGHPEYEDRLHHMVADLHLADRVTFHKPIPRPQLPAFLAKYDALLLPSTWEEHLALISEEAMASGLVLVATLTGGTPELLIDGVNGLAFGRENAQELADQLVRLAHDVTLRQRLSEAAWQTIQERFTLERTVDKLERFFTEIAHMDAGPSR